MTVVNIVNQEPPSNPQMHKSASVQAINHLNRGQVQKTPYFGQKRIKVGLKKDLQRDIFGATRNEGVHTMSFNNQFNKFDQEWNKVAQPQVRKESDDEQEYEDSFYDIATDSDREKHKTSGPRYKK